MADLDLPEDERRQLRAIVAVWLTNGHKPVDAANDTRYEMFEGGWFDAAEATRNLWERNLVEAPDANSGIPDVSIVTPTARGVFEVLAT